MTRAESPRTSIAWLGVGISLLGVGLCAAMNLAGGGPLSKARLGYLDALISSRSPVVLDGPDDPVVIVGIDAETYDRLGKKIISRADYASVVNRLKAAEPKAIAFDVLFTGRDPTAVGMDTIVSALGSTPELVSLRENLDPDRLLVDAMRGAPVITGFLTVPTSSVPDTSEYSAATIPDLNVLDAKDCENFANHFDRVLANGRSLQEVAPTQGNCMLEPDPVDRNIRRYPLFVRMGEQIYPSLALAAVSQFRGGMTDPEGFVSMECDGSDHATVAKLTVGANDYRIPADYDGSRLPLDFRGNSRESFPNYVPFWKAMQTTSGTATVSDDRFRGKVVFIGEWHELVDTHKTSVDSKFHGVGFHALATHSILTRHWLRRDPFVFLMWEPLATLLVGLAATALIVLVGNPYPPIGVAISLPFAGYLLSQWFVEHGYLVDAATPGMVGFFAIFSCGVARFVLERSRAEDEKKHRMTAEREFSRFLSPNVAKIALQDANLLAPAKKEISILFSDIRGFTTTAETMAPEALVALLGEYLTSMTRLVFDYGGTLDKYIGDAVMAIYGAPVDMKDHARLACWTALLMGEKLEGLQEDWKTRGLPMLEIGIGINTGVVSVGMMGSQSKVEYTCIGDEVNFASRIEGLTKVYGIRILVGENTREKAGNEFVFRDLGPVKVKGKKKSVRIFELLTTRALMPSDPEWLGAFAKGLRAFHERDWNGAEAAFVAADAGRAGGDGPSRTLLDWTRRFREKPPPSEWDGTFEQREK